MNKSLAIISFTDRGGELADLLIAGCAWSDVENGAMSNNQNLQNYLKFSEVKHYPCERGGLAALVFELFARFDVLLFIGAAGIAVRAIAPYVRSKMSDPAVVVADERAGFVIPILSGHVGGANEAALYIAGLLGATPVITTATDINGAFAVDTWAAERGYIIANPEKIKDVSMKALGGKRIRIFSDAQLACRPPEEQADVCVLDGLNAEDIEPFLKKRDTNNTALCDWNSACRDMFALHPDVYVGVRLVGGDFLRLVPKSLYVGIGCRRGAGREAVARLFDRVFAAIGIDARAIAAIASIDLKSDEGGLLAFAGERGYDLRFFSADELMSLDGIFSASEFVESVTGVDCVCERAALLASDGGRLILRKTSADGVTIAVAESIMI